MACEELKAKHDALQARLNALNAEIAKEPKPEQSAGHTALEKLSAEVFQANQALAECLAAQPKPKGTLPAVAPQQILEIVNVMSPDWVANAKAALQKAIDSITQMPPPFPYDPKRDSNEFPVDVGSEWIQPLAPTTEYDEDTVGVAGWMVNPRVVTGDFPFSHPFRNGIDGTPFDFEFSMLLDRPAANPTQFDFLLTPGNKAPAVNPSPSDERAQDENYAHDAGLSYPAGLLGVEMDSANIPRGFINGVETGNRVAVFGRWIIDTAHALVNDAGPKRPRTEIHPPLLMAAASEVNPDTTRVLFTSRAYLVGDTFTTSTDPKVIYDDDNHSKDDGTFFHHLLNELEKLNDTLPLLGIPLESTQVEAHPKVKSQPFRGIHLMHFQIRPPVVHSIIGVAQRLQVSYKFTVRTGCTVEVTSSAPDTVDVYVGMNSANYKAPPLQANSPTSWTRSELAALNSSIGSDYLGGEVLSAAYQLVFKTSLIGAALVDHFLSNGIKTDSYAPLNDLVDINATQGAAVIGDRKFPFNVGITVNNDQPFPVYGWLEAKWVSAVSVNEGATEVSTTTHQGTSPAPAPVKPPPVAPPTPVVKPPEVHPAPEPVEPNRPHVPGTPKHSQN